MRCSKRHWRKRFESVEFGHSIHYLWPSIVAPAQAAYPECRPAVPVSVVKMKTEAIHPTVRQYARVPRPNDAPRRCRPGASHHLAPSGFQPCRGKAHRRFWLGQPGCCKCCLCHGSIGPSSRTSSSRPHVDTNTELRLKHATPGPSLASSCWPPSQCPGQIVPVLCRSNTSQTPATVVVHYPEKRSGQWRCSRSSA